MKKVAVVILNWNGEELLKKFLPSVLATLPEYAEAIIADNASTDGSIAFLNSTYPKIKIIQNTTNGGFAKGYNEALTHVHNEYVVLLNSDIETPENWVEPMTEFMDKNPKVGAAMPKILQYKNKTHFEYAGAAGGYIDQWGFPFCRGRIFDTLEEDKGQYNNNEPVFWASGACMFVRNDTFKKLNGFDEFFFAHMEEIDLCWRMQRAGYLVYAVGESHVYHLGGGTLNKLSPKKTFLNFRNSLFLLIKNYPSHNFLIKMTQKLLLDGLASVKFLFEGNVRHFFAVFKAHMSFYANLFKYLKIRKKLTQQYTNKEIIGVYKPSIAKEYFIAKKNKYSDLAQDSFL